MISVSSKRPGRVERIPHAAEMVVDLLDESLVGRPHRLPHFVAHEVGAFLLFAVRGQYRMRVDELARVAIHGQALVQRVARVVRRGRDVRPMRLDVRQVQHPRAIAALGDEVDCAVGRVRGLRIGFGDACRKSRIAHVPSRHDTAVGIDGGDHVVGPRVAASRSRADEDTTRTRCRAPPWWPSWRSSSVKPPLARSAAECRTTAIWIVEVETRKPGEIGHDVRLAGQRQLDAGVVQVFAQRDLADRKRHAIPRRAMARHVAAGVHRHARRSANARLHEGTLEAHAARRQRVDVSRRQYGCP